MLNTGTVKKIKTPGSVSSRPFNIIFCVIIITLNSGYALTVGYNKEITLLTGFFLILLFFKAISAGLLFKKTLQPDAVFLLFMLISIILTLIVNTDFAAAGEYIRIFIIIMSAFLIIRLLSFDQFIYYFTRLMRILTLISLLFFSIIRFTNIIFPVIKNAAGVQYYTVYIFSTNYVLYQLKQPRNSAIFWEAGMFAAFIMLALIIEIALIPRTNAVFIVIPMYIAALISTGSTTAYVFIILTVTMLLSYKANKAWSAFLLIISLAAVLVFLFNFNEIISGLAIWQPEVFRKILIKNRSLTDRLYNPAADMLVCFHHPFGSGVGKLTELSQHYALQQFGTALGSRTSTLTYFFAAFGYLGGLVFNLAWITGFIKTNLTLLTKAIIILSVLVLSTSTPLNTNMAFWIILFGLLQPLVLKKHLRK